MSFNMPAGTHNQQSSLIGINYNYLKSSLTTTTFSTTVW